VKNLLIVPIFFQSYLGRAAMSDASAFTMADHGCGGGRAGRTVTIMMLTD
jgi:hypothetical protein